MSVLGGIRLVTIAPNVPGPVAAARLRDLGAAVVKVEPPAGDPLAAFAPGWYSTLHEGIVVWRLDLQERNAQEQFAGLLREADLLLTSSRPAALARLGLAWPVLRACFPRLAQVAIVGHPAPGQDRPGHDLTYLAQVGLLTPPDLPTTLMADLLGAERAVSAALALLIARDRDGAARYVEVALADAAATLAAPLHAGLTVPGGILGGGFGGYNLYQTREGWVALATLEPRFWQRLLHALDLSGSGDAALRERFLSRSAGEWEAWAAERDLPLVAVRKARSANRGPD